MYLYININHKYIYIYIYIDIYKICISTKVLNTIKIEPYNNFFRKGKRATTNLRLLVSRYLVHQVNS